MASNVYSSRYLRYVIAEKYSHPHNCRTSLQAVPDSGVWMKEIRGGEVAPGLEDEGWESGKSSIYIDICNLHPSQSAFPG
jgi:hypothetical protein